MSAGLFWTRWGFMSWGDMTIYEHSKQRLKHDNCPPGGWP